MNNLKRISLVIIVIILALLFMQRKILASQFAGDVRVQKVWNNEEKVQENRKIYNNIKKYNKYDEISTNIFKIIIILVSVLTIYLVISNNIKLKNYYIFMAVLAILYVVINRYLVETYLKNGVTGLRYVKIMLVTVGVCIGIFAQGKIQKLLMCSTPALVVVILGLMGQNMRGVWSTAFIIWIFTQIILLPQYFKKEENKEEEIIKEL